MIISLIESEENFPFTLFGLQLHADVLHEHIMQPGPLEGVDVTIQYENNTDAATARADCGSVIFYHSTI